MRVRMLFLPALALLAACGGDDDSGAPTAVPTATSPPQATSTPPPSPTRTPSPSPTLGPGANITFFGVLRSDNTLLDPSGFDDTGRPIFERAVGSGFVIVVEAAAGTSRARPGDSTFDYDPEDPTVLPDLQIESNRDLGDGSAAVCDTDEEHFGGVPGVDPGHVGVTPEVLAAALNDLGCRFLDGAGATRGRNAQTACILYPDAEFRFATSKTQVQFCSTVVRKARLPGGDTIFTARVRDMQGIVGPARQIVIRVAVSE